MKKIAAIALAVMALTGCAEDKPNIELNNRLCVNLAISDATREAEFYEIGASEYYTSGLRAKVEEIAKEQCQLEVARANATEAQRLVMNQSMNLVNAGLMFQDGYSYEEAAVIRKAKETALNVGINIGSKGEQDARIWAAKYNSK